MNVDNRLCKLLTEIGFMAAYRGYIPEAVCIFEGLSKVMPDSVIPYLGQSLTEICNGDFTSAINLLENNALMMEPDNDMAKAFLGLAKTLDGQISQSQKILDEVSTSEDLQAASLAKTILEDPPGT